jgi:hypothetical protein
MGSKGDGKRRRPRKTAEESFATEEPRNYESSTPKFCLHHLQDGFRVSDLHREQQQDFALALQTRCSLTWQQIATNGRHALGYEFIPADQIIPPIPRVFEDAARFMVFRYSGFLPMAGVRVQDVFQIVWIEAKFGDLYDHGS